MRIEVQDFESGSGVIFLITAANPTERALLVACVGGESDILMETGDSANEFCLSLPVSNG